MKHATLIQRSTSFLLVVDIQARLAPAIDNHESITERNQWLLGIASELDVPRVVTEQYPKGLGHTIDALQQHIKGAHVVEKTHFNAFAEEAVKTYLQQLKRPQVIITGTEAHVCVLQTALDMHAHGFQVFIVADAIGSRQPANKQVALERMRGVGCQVVTSEMVAFEWLHRSATDEFRHISKNYIR